MSDAVGSLLERDDEFEAVADEGLSQATQPADPGQSPAPRMTRLYRVVWRWHFYAGLLITPLLVLLAITGGLYIFKSEILDSAYRNLVFVEPASSQVPYQKQVEAALAAYPGSKASRIRVAPSADLATIVTLTPPGGQPVAKGTPRRTLDVYVNPANGVVLGGVASDAPLNAFFSTVLKLHRSLFAGMTGRIINELATSWTIVLLITGLYLWWPKHWRVGPGVWTIRYWAKPYTVLRDLHSVVGVYLFLPCLIIAATGMFYTPWVGWEIREGARRWVGPEPAAARPSTATTVEPPSLSLNELVDVARQRYPDRFLTATLATGSGAKDLLAIKAMNDIYRPYGPMQITDLAVERSTGTIRKSTDDTRTMFFWHTWTYPLHVGSVLGLTTKILWLIACLILVALPVTGAWMWWERRPRGRTGFPRRPTTTIPGRLVSLILLLGLVLPVMGTSVLLILIGEAIYSRGIGARLSPG